MLGLPNPPRYRTIGVSPFTHSWRWWIFLGGLAGLLALATLVVFLPGNSKLNKKIEVPVEAVTVATEAQAIQRGQHLATIFMCTTCHTDNLGGKV